MYEQFRLYKNYAIIGVVSLILLIFLPFIGSEVGLALVLPNTTAGWIIYIITKIIVAAANVLILYCFVNQGKFNIRNDKRYIGAITLLGQVSSKKKPVPLSPAQHYRKVYGLKGTFLFVATVLSSFALTQAILVFSANTFLTYLITLISGVIFGILQMEQEEIFWTEEFPDYVNYLLEEKEKQEVPPCEENPDPTLE